MLNEREIGQHIYVDAFYSLMISYLLLSNQKNCWDSIDKSKKIKNTEKPFIVVIFTFISL